MMLYLIQERQELIYLLSGANIAWLLASLPLALLGNSAVAGLFGQLLSAYGVSIERSRIYPMFFYSNLTKYIPGKVWSMLYQHLSLPTTTSRPTVVMVNLDLTVWQLSGCSLLALFLGYYHTPLVAVGLSALLSIPLIKSGFFNRLGNILSIILPTQFALTTHYKAPPALSLFIHSLLFWSCFVLSQGLLIVALLDIPWSTALLLVGCLSAAWVVGTLSILTPAGIGIREVVFVALARQTGLDLALDSLAILALSLRLWQVVHEILGAALVTILVTDRASLWTRQ